MSKAAQKAVPPAHSKQAIVRSGTLRQIAVCCPEPQGVVLAQNEELDFALLPELTLPDFEEKLRAAARKKSRMASLRYRLDGFSLVVFSLLFSLGVAVLFGLLSLYEELFKNLVIRREFEQPEHIFLFASCALIFILIVTLVPSVLGGESSKFREWLQQWYNHNRRVQRRILRGIHLLTKNGCQEIRIWNACVHAQSSWVWQCLLPSLMRAPAQTITFHVRSGQDQMIVNLLERCEGQNRKIAVEWQEPGLLQVPTTEVQLSRIKELMPDGDKTLLDLLLLCSTFNLNENEQQSLTRKDFRLKGIVSMDLADFLASRYGQHLSGPNGLANIPTLTSFTRRCRQDYQILLREQVGHHPIHRLVEACHALAPQARNNFSAIVDHMLSEIPEFLNQNNDPLAAVVLLGLGEDSEMPDNLFNALLNNLIQSTRNKEMYFLVAAIWSLLSKGYDRGDKFPRLRIYGKLSLSALQNLCELFERSGHFAEALELARHLHPIHPAEYAMIGARLLERKGDYPKALHLLLEDSALKSLRKQNANDTNFDILLRYQLHLSWTVVSSRMSDWKKEGLNAVEQARKILADMLVEQRNPFLLWRLHNNCANYAEWDDDLDACLAEHEQCIEIPGVEQKWISGSYVNLGIAYRLLFIKQNDPNTLQRAFHFGQEGVRLKQQIGDNDELPVALHNVALTWLEGLLSGQDMTPLCEAQGVIAMTEQGLELLRQASSSKKMGMLLAERFILSVAADAPQNTTKTLRRDLEQWLEQPVNRSLSDHQTVTELLRKASEHFGTTLVHENATSHE